MKEHRNPHPHLDPRQPRDHARPGANPPVFAWKPTAGAGSFRLQAAGNSSFESPVLDERHLRDPLYLPVRRLEPGPYYWKWSDGERESEVFQFQMGEETPVLEVPPAAEWLAALPAVHPRIHVAPDQVEPLRQALKGERAADLQRLLRSADAVLTESHHIDEPEFLPDRSRDYQAFWRVWYPTMWQSRAFVKGAETLGLAFVATGDRKYARAACQRLTSISRWDPEGSSYLGHNDEAHMSVIWHGSTACDWVWEEFTEEERKLVIEQFRRRGQITFEHMHDRGSYGITRFDSHAGREIVFLALLAFVFHEEIPEAATWLEWLRPVLCGIWPIWAGDDGGWAEGPSYGLAYVTIMTMFASALKRATGIDLYRHPFWTGHAQWRQWWLPPYAEWMGFGDHSQRWRGTWERAGDLVDVIARETGASEFNGYVDAMRAQTEFDEEPGERHAPGVNSQLFLAPERPAISTGARGDSSGALKVFATAGLAAVRTDLENPHKDVAFLFRSSPFGAISHSHANHNDFILHVGGRIMAMPTGYYGPGVGYGSDHHAHWVWHTKAHNCVTLSDAGQIMRSYASAGRVAGAFEDERLVYFAGIADAAYADRAQRCRRHVAYLKAHRAFVMVDEFVAAEGIVSALQWNIHSWNPFEVDEEGRSFRLQRGDSGLRGHFLWHDNAFFSLSEGWDPAPADSEYRDLFTQQYHLRFTPSGLISQRNLGVVLAAELPGEPAAQVLAERSGKAEAARIGEDRVIVDVGAGLEVDGELLGGVALLEVGGVRYAVGEGGIHRA